MKLIFYKYQGTGNDFIIIDNRNDFFSKKNIVLIKDLCHRKFGIGADGLMLLETSINYDFKMVYFNADGNEGSMCGNGGRCIVAFAKKLKIIKSKTTFEAIDGIHQATINNNIVSLKMNNINLIEDHKEHIFLNTGSPHHVEFLDDISKIDVFNKGKEIRYGSPYFEKGTNVNFVQQIKPDIFKVRTYERGVENETLSCGTGVIAVAIAADYLQRSNSNNIKLQTLGGDLEVSFQNDKNSYKQIKLKGPATYVFKGSIEI
ncbi:MAG: diaminopimelate epimerase [Bacteroidota bacterium]